MQERTGFPLAASLVGTEEVPPGTTEELHLHNMQLTAPESHGTPRVNRLRALPLLARATPRSEDDPDPEQQAIDCEAVAATTEMYRVTGTFSDPSHELAFAAQLFRMAFPCHALLMALTIAVTMWVAVASPPGTRAFWGVFALCTSLGLLGRVLVHCMHDLVRAQQIGAWIWTFLMALACVCGVTGYYFAAADACVPASLDSIEPLLALTLALTNGTHGMSFWHKGGVLSLMLVCDLVVWAICGPESKHMMMLCDMAVLVVGSAIAHKAELCLRHSYSSAPQSRGACHGYAAQVLERRRLAELGRRQTETEERDQLPQTGSEHESDLNAADIVIHPVTGAFAGPTHESAFAAQLFRMAFPCHALLMVLMVVLSISILILTPPDLRLGQHIVLALFVFTIGLVGRVLLHEMLDSARAQRIGSWTWTVLVVVLASVDASSYMMAPSAACALMSEQHFLPLMDLAIAITNGTHGMGFKYRAALTSFMLAYSLLPMAICREVALLPVILCELGVFGIGSAAVHVAELLLRHRYAEKVQENERRRVYGRLEERMEQLQAEKERLLYDVQRRGRLIDDENHRSAIRRGLQAAPRQPCHPAGDTGSSEAGAPAPSHPLQRPIATRTPSPPSSFPPGPPSSSAESGSAAWLAPTHAALAAPTHPTLAASPGHYPTEKPGSELSDMSDLPELADLAELVELPELSELTSALSASVPTSSAKRAKVAAAAHLDDSPDSSAPANPKAASETTAGQGASLQERFVTHVMCDYTLRSPRELPMSKWASCARLLAQLQEHAPSETSQLTPDQLKQRITGWFQDHPAYAGLSFNQWGKRLKDRSNPHPRARHTVFHFPFEYTPRGAAAGQ